MGKVAVPFVKRVGENYEVRKREGINKQQS